MHGEAEIHYNNGVIFKYLHFNLEDSIKMEWKLKGIFNSQMATNILEIVWVTNLTDKAL
jgi:hypothetical protein